eukprot:403334639
MLRYRSAYRHQQHFVMNELILMRDGKNAICRDALGNETMVDIKHFKTPTQEEIIKMQSQGYNVMHLMRSYFPVIHTNVTLADQEQQKEILKERRRRQMAREGKEFNEAEDDAEQSSLMQLFLIDKDSIKLDEQLAVNILNGYEIDTRIDPSWFVDDEQTVENDSQPQEEQQSNQQSQSKKSINKEKGEDKTIDV